MAQNQCNSGTVIQLINCRLVYQGKIVKDDFWIRNGKILNPEELFYIEKNIATLKIDCGDLLIAPGYIDVQLNGGFGYDFSSNVENVEEAIYAVAKGILQHGVTSFCPTIVTSPTENYKKILPHFKRKDGGKHGAQVLGAHIEGPFINVEKKGAHDKNLIKNDVPFGIKSLEDVYGSLDSVAIITVAPELPGMMEAIPKLVEKNIKVSIGHSLSDIVVAEEAFKNGATFITHLFNAMLPFHHRDPGIVGLLTSKTIPRRPYYGIISDGIHTHPAALRIAYRSHPHGLVLVTDAIVALGLPPGVHNVGTMEVNITERDARILGTNTLAGSICSMDTCVRNFRRESGCSTTQAIEAATLRPAQMLGIEKSKGTLDYGTDADFILLNCDLNVQATFIAGVPVFVNNTTLADELKKIS